MTNIYIYIKYFIDEKRRPFFWGEGGSQAIALVAYSVKPTLQETISLETQQYSQSFKKLLKWYVMIGAHKNNVRDKPI